ncbi:hypothetical protein ACNKHT_24670 [Shigella flexneri]
MPCWWCSTDQNHEKLSGGIRTALAQYRELAAFSFASDLDDATRKPRLDHGRESDRTAETETVCADVRSQQYLVLFAARTWLHGGCELRRIRSFEAALLATSTVITLR